MPCRPVRAETATEVDTDADAHSEIVEERSVSGPSREGLLAVGTLAAGSGSVVAFGGIAVAVSAGVFLGPALETRRRSTSVRTAAGGPRRGVPPQPPDAGYQALFDAEQRRAYRIAALMTASADRATAIAEETFARTLQQWTRLPADRRVWFVLSTDVKMCLGSAFVGALGGGGDRSTGGPAGADDLLRAARALSVLEPTRRAIAILAHGEGLSVEEIAAVIQIPPGQVTAELAAALKQLGPVLGTAAA
jgi:DNA-directed RNA polymerase specialized sigma24 family protein